MAVGLGFREGSSIIMQKYLLKTIKKVQKNRKCHLPKESWGWGGWVVTLNSRPRD